MKMLQNVCKLTGNDVDVKLLTRVDVWLCF